MRPQGALQIPPLRFGRDDNGRAVAFRMGGDLDGQTYERLLWKICVSHPSQEREGWERIQREEQMLLPAVTEWGAHRLVAGKSVAEPYISSSTKARATSGGMR
jgi:hypothetical protein